MTKSTVTLRIPDDQSYRNRLAPYTTPAARLPRSSLSPSASTSTVDTRCAHSRARRRPVREFHETLSGYVSQSLHVRVRFLAMMSVSFSAEITDESAHTSISSQQIGQSSEMSTQTRIERGSLSRRIFRAVSQRRQLTHRAGLVLFPVLVKIDENTYFSTRKRCSCPRISFTTQQ